MFCVLYARAVRLIHNLVSHVFNMEIFFKSIKMGRIFNKTRGNISYEILDEEAYERYWWGRRPSTRMVVEAWLGDPDSTQRYIEKEHGKKYNFIHLKMSNLLKMGIVRRFKRKD